jgi:BirA family biotin operon repressor/biotin-[acetyl-CoA-carboxylase] ligase
MPILPPPFDLDRVERQLAGTRFARLRHVTTTGSTNADLMLDAHAGAPDGTVLVADEQTAGRGRSGHAWHSAVGDGLYLSILVRPRTTLPLDRALWLSLATGLAAKRAIDALLAAQQQSAPALPRSEASATDDDSAARTRPDHINLPNAGRQPAKLSAASRTDIRWPNDLLLDGKKCGGILVESAVTPSAAGAPATLRFAILGIGLNLNQPEFPPELAALATSLRLATGLPCARETMLVHLLGELEEELAALECEAADTENHPSGSGTEPDETLRIGKHSVPSGLLARFTRASTWVHGKHVHVAEAGGYTGVTAGLDLRGYLTVVDDDGRLRTVLSGGVRAR